MTVLNNITADKITLLDGAMGTILIKAGIDIGACPEILNIEKPAIIKDIHRQYIESGADVIYSNTFGCSKTADTKYSLEEIISSAFKTAKEAIGGSGCLAAYDMGPTGKLLEPMGSLSFDEAYEIFKKQAVLAQKYGADMIVCETFTDLYEIKAALLAVKENTSLPVMCTMSYESDMRTFTGTDVRCMAITLESLGACAVGINCSLGPDEIIPIAKELLKYTSLPVIVKANAGKPHSDGTYSVSAKEFAASCKEMLDAGVSIIGGCCGTTPEYIAELKRLASGRKPFKREYKEISAVCSASKFVKIDGVKVIGERLNPTGKKLYREALIKGDTDFILQQAWSQAEAGADILDVNVGLPQIDETEAMAKTVKVLQSVLNLPLQIDSSNPAAIEKALRYYNGKPIVNSVNGDEESLEGILPLVKKYGACVIGLTLDKSGLPKTADRRIEIAEKIIRHAEKYNIRKSDVIIDPLALTVSAEQEQAYNTLEAVERLSKMGIKTVLGISNISFGLPQRENINLAFMLMALKCGLNLPIINPNSEIMMDAVNAFRVISGQDENAAEYILKYNSGAVAQNVSGNIAKDLEYLILKGLKKECAEETARLLETLPPLETVNKHIIPALDKAGILFEKGSLFLPQLIQTAETAKCAFAEIKKRMPKSCREGGKILLATVKGDIHDIGKNIVKTVLENYGYTIIDLGKNVEIEQIVKTAIEHKIKLIGLSALMTTTVANMEKTIKAIRSSGHKCSIMAGGAVLTEDYAMQIGADYYAKDANCSVKIAREVFKENN